VATTRKVSSAQLRAIAASLHREAAAQGKRPQTDVITAEATATGQGLIRFRASKVLDAYKTGAPSRRRKSTTRIRAAR
jgi:hypothetical protein